MAGTFIELPPTSGQSLFWLDPVAAAGSLPLTDSFGAVRLVTDAGVLYYFDGVSTWSEALAKMSPSAATNTNSISVSITSGVLSSSLRLSTNAADVNYLAVTNNIETSGTVGLRSQIATSSVRGVVSATTPLSYSAATGVFSIAQASSLVSGYISSGDWATFNGKVAGPGSSTDTAVARFSGTGGATLLDSGVTIDESNNMSGVTRLNATTAKIGATGAVTTSVTLEVAGTSGAFLLPRMTTTQRDVLTATGGMLIYNTTTNMAQCYIAGTTNAWVDLAGWGS